MKKTLVLVPDWKRAWRFASIRWSFFGVVVMGLFEALHYGWVALPSQVADRIPNAPLVALVIYVLVMLGRLFKLIYKEKPDDGQEASQQQN